MDIMQYSESCIWNLYAQWKVYLRHRNGVRVTVVNRWRNALERVVRYVTRQCSKRLRGGKEAVKLEMHWSLGVVCMEQQETGEWVERYSAVISTGNKRRKDNKRYNNGVGEVWKQGLTNYLQSREGSSGTVWIQKSIRCSVVGVEVEYSRDTV